MALIHITQEKKYMESGGHGPLEKLQNFKVYEIAKYILYYYSKIDAKNIVL